MGFMRNRNTKIISLAVLLGVLCITVGYAAFSSVLTIRTGASVNPDASTFNVDFSTSSTSVVAGSVTGSGTNGATSGAAVIDNSTDPTISNLQANFTAPGQVVTYTFYAYNAGQYVAYLTDVIFQNVTGSSTNKVCTAGTGATASLVSAACNGISVKVEVGGLTAATTTEVSNHPLAINTAEQVKVTITYASGSAVADGNFTVNFGDITLTYSSLDETNGGGIVTPTAVCTAPNGTDENDLVTCGTENFYVIKNDGSTITMIAAQNITPVEEASGVSYKETGNLTASLLNGKSSINATVIDYPKQSASAGTVTFSSNIYWTNSIASLEAPSSSQGDTMWYYDLNNENVLSLSNVYPTLTAYKSYLENSIGISAPNVRLINIDDIDINMLYDMYYGTDLYLKGEYEDIDSFVGYFTGIGKENGIFYVCLIEMGNSGDKSDDALLMFSDFEPKGIRPVIEMPVSNVQ